MKALITALALLLTGIGASSATQVRFRGDLVFTGISNCASQTKGNSYKSAYVPRKIADNGDYAILTTVTDLNAASYQLDKREFDATLRAVEAKGIAQGAWNFSAKVAVTARSPATISTTTRFVTLRGRIERPWGDTGANGKSCVVEFDAAYVRQ